MPMVCKSGRILLSMRVNGLITRQTAKDNFGVLMEMFTKENGKTIKRMVLADFFRIKEKNNTSACGKMIFITVRVWKAGRMVQDTMEVIHKVRKMAMELISGQMEHFTKVTG